MKLRIATLPFTSLCFLSMLMEFIFAHNIFDPYNMEIFPVYVISPSSLGNITDQKQQENVKYFSSLGSAITNDARCVCEIKSRIVMATAALNSKKTVFTGKVDLNI